MAFLVYVKGSRGPEPHKWPELLRDNIGGKVRPHLAKHELSDDEAALPIDKLVAKYPPPIQEVIS